MIDRDLLKMLVCPESRLPLDEADPSLLARLNAAIRAGQVRNQGGQTLERPLEGGLVRQDRAVLYPILDGIPVLMADEAISLDQLTPPGR